MSNPNICIACAGPLPSSNEKLHSVCRKCVAKGMDVAGPEPAPSPVQQAREIQPFGALTECEHQHPRYSCAICTEYRKMAERIMRERDVWELASALKVRDYACAEFVKAKGLTHDPEDSDVCKWLETGAYHSFRTQADAEKKAEKIAIAVTEAIINRIPDVHAIYLDAIKFNVKKETLAILREP